MGDRPQEPPNDQHGWTEPNTPEPPSPPEMPPMRYHSTWYRYNPEWDALQAWSLDLGDWTDKVSFGFIKFAANLKQAHQLQAADHLRATAEGYPDD